jgi:hypothetical protein
MNHDLETTPVRDIRFTAATASALAAALLLAACGQSEPEPEAAGAPEPVELSTGGSETQAAVEQAREDARAATEAAGEQDPLANLSDATAQDAMESYLTALGAGDFIRAAEFCHPDAPGTAKLIQTGQGLEAAMQDPEARAMGLQGLLTQGISQATYELLEEGEDRATFEVMMPGKTPAVMDVVLLDEGWRVIPPDATGLPTN